MHNFTVAIINGSYIYQLQSSHNQAVCVRSIKGNHIYVAYIRLNFISGRYLGFTYKDTGMLQFKNRTQYKTYLIKLNNCHINLTNIKVKTPNKSHHTTPVTQVAAGNMCGLQ